jgi:hypothetical protein
MRLDHVIYGTRDLEQTAAALEREHGLAFQRGGRHPGGTINMVAPLEPPQYLELLAVARRLNLEVGRGSITREDGNTGSWQFVYDPGSDSLPFFIRYDDDPEDRLRLWQERAREVGNLGFGGFTFIEVAGDEAEIRGALGGAALPVRFVHGRPGLHAVGIAGPTSEIVLREALAG